MANDSQFQQLGFDFDFHSTGDPASPDVADDYRRAAERGDSNAQLQLAQLYRFGAVRVARDLVAARVWYEVAAANGNSTAVRSGPSVEARMPPEAIAEARFQIGELYLNGAHVPRNGEAAHDWFRRAAAQGHTRAQLSLGKMHRVGTACQASSIRAYAWFCVARRQNSADAGRFADELRTEMTDAEVSSAWLRVGETYRNGTEVPTDPEEALF